MHRLSGLLLTDTFCQNNGMLLCLRMSLVYGCAVSEKRALYSGLRINHYYPVPVTYVTVHKAAVGTKEIGHILTLLCKIE